MVYGPFLVHLNSVSDGEDPYKLWNMAKDQALKEHQNWPYDFPQSQDYVSPCQRGSVNGQLIVYDRYNNSGPQPGSSAWIGLAPPGDKGFWQLYTRAISSGLKQMRMEILRSKESFLVCTTFLHQFLVSLMNSDMKQILMLKQGPSWHLIMSYTSLQETVQLYGKSVSLTALLLSSSFLTQIRIWLTAYFSMEQITD